MRKIKVIASTLFGLLCVLGLTACPSEGNPTILIPRLGNLSPSQLNLSSKVNQSKATHFSFENLGNSTLNFSLNSNQSWLELNPRSGSLAALQSQTIAVLANCLADAGNQSATISISSNDPDKPSQTLQLSLVCSEATSSDYTIMIAFSGSGVSASREAIFQEAASRWSKAIIGDINDERFDPGVLSAQTACGYADSTSITEVDDLIIFARIGPIDGTGNGNGNILGQAGPAVVRGNGQTIVGCMEFDEADVPALEASGSFADVVLHEMGHVLGIGTLWNYSIRGTVVFDLLSFQTSDSSCSSATSFSSKPVFTGSNALAEFSALGQNGNVPVEDEFGPGTQCGHWDEGVFDHELMTGFAEKQGTMPLSRLTIASLKDLGYEVNLAAANSYAIPACSPKCSKLLGSQSLEKPWERVLAPRAYINEAGELIWLDR